MSRGAVGVGALRFPVIDLALDGGTLVVTATVPGPMGARDRSAAVVTLFGVDGKKVCTFVDSVGWPRLRIGARTNLVVSAIMLCARRDA